jgi:hypothetical protein
MYGNKIKFIRIQQIKTNFFIDKEVLILDSKIFL